MIKSYIIDCPLTQSKINHINNIFKEYNYIAKVINNIQWQNFYKTGKFTNYKGLDIKTIKGDISQRYKKNILIQITGMLDSYLSNRKNDFVKLVYQTNLPDNIKQDLFFVNKYNYWYNKEPIKYLKDTKTIALSTIKLARHIMNQLLKINKKPKINIHNMNLGVDVVQITKSIDPKYKNNNNHLHDYWANLSTLEKGKKINLPININRYINKNKNNIKNYLQITKKLDNLQFVLCKEFNDKKDKYKPKINQVGIDLGLRILFTSSQKKYYGKDFIDKLYEYDKKLIKLLKAKQKQNLPLIKSKKYRKLSIQLKEFIKNEINKYINKIVKKERPSKIVLENLNFKSPKLSKRLNRILSNFGKSLIKKKFEQLTNEYGIVIEYINPAYTSQTCSKCNYPSKHNRKSQDKFCCEYCNLEDNILKSKLSIDDYLKDFKVVKTKITKKYYYKNREIKLNKIKMNADHNASLIINGRSSTINKSKIHLYDNKMMILDKITKYFVGTLQHSHHSMALSLENSYLDNCFQCKNNT